MHSDRWLRPTWFALAALLPAWFSPAADAAANRARPNTIFILADDLGWGELGCYGQRLIKTPNLDRMAAEGMRFPQFYAGATVCAPSRSVLMTGQHHGHTRVRGNAAPEAAGPQMLRDEDVTVAEVLSQAGYATGLVGKWGLGMPADQGVPTKQGFHYFFGYLSQHQAHNYYPDYLWRNDQRVSLPNGVMPVGKDGGGCATNRVVYSPDLFAEEALRFIEQNKDRPFFLHLCLTVPHANNEKMKLFKDGTEVPDLGIYLDKDWTPQNKAHAAMITRMDGDIGRLFAALKKFGIDAQTVVFFSSDNGPHRESGQDPKFFKSSGPFSGLKRDLTDGGIRVPFIVRWPGHIKPRQVSKHVGYFGDFMATAAELAGATPPSNIDSLSLVPTLLGQEARQRTHPYLYWEFHEGGSSQAVLIEGRWKAMQLKRRDAPIQLFDLRKDPAESKDLATKKPDLVARARDLFKSARTDNPDWPLKDAKAAQVKEATAR